MGRKKAIDEDDDDGDLAPPSGYVERPSAWEAKPIAKQVQHILDALEAPAIDKATRSTLQRYLYRRQKFGDRDEWGKDGRGYVTLLVRTITESTGNENALIEPVVVAVSSCMRPKWVNRGLDWLAAWDQIPLLDTLNKLRDLKLFDENELRHFYTRTLVLKLREIFGPDEVAAPPKKPAAKRKTDRPSWASERTWDDVMALRKRKPKQPARAA